MYLERERERGFGGIKTETETKDFPLLEGRVCEEKGRLDSGAG